MPRHDFLRFFCCFGNASRVSNKDIESKNAVTELTSPAISSSDVAPIIRQAGDAFSTTLREKQASENEIESLNAFSAMLLEKNMAENEIKSLFAYLGDLLEQETQVPLYRVAIDFMLQTRQVLQLNATSLAFLNELSTKSPASYRELLQKIAQRGPSIFLKNHHLDAVIAIFQAQRSLSPHVQQKIDGFSLRKDIKTVVQALRAQHFPEIITQSKQEKLLHHTLAHAAEIKIRAMRMIDILELLDGDSNNFLRQLAKFGIEGHDLKQKNPGAYPTVELATAAQLEEWLVDALALDESFSENQSIRDYIHLVLHKIIVLGTTMIFSHESTLDLSELFYWVEEAADVAKMDSGEPSNQALMQKLDVIALLTGVCDKTPSALYEVVDRQMRQAETNSLIRLQSFYKDLILDKFITSSTFQSYFSRAPAEINAQAFMMGLVPHLCMRAELTAADKKHPLATKAEVFIAFVRDCQNKFSERDEHKRVTHEVLKGYFDTQFGVQRMDQHVDELFFSMLDGEIEFSHSQVRSLAFVQERLIKWGYLKSDAVSKESFLNAQAPHTDALNLKALRHFYQNLDAEKRIRLSRELVLNVVMQAGAAYLIQPSLGLQSEPTTPANHPASSEKIWGPSSKHTYLSQRLNRSSKQILADESADHRSLFSLLPANTGLQ